MADLTPATSAATRATRAESADPKELAQREIRRGNLLLITSPSGAKSNLGRLTGLSAANVSHRLHGNKIFDKLTGQFFSQVLGLPENWFEAPHTESDIPPATLTMLTSSNSVAHPATVPAKAPRAKNGERGVRTKTSGLIPGDLAGTRKRGRPRKSDTESLPPSGIRLDLSSSTAVPRANLSSPRLAPAPASNQVLPPPAKVATAAAPSPEPVALEQVALKADTPVVRVAARPEKITPSGKVGMMVKALLQTLEQKAQDGRLTEEAAMRMLVEINML